MGLQDRLWHRNINSCSAEKLCRIIIYISIPQSESVRKIKLFSSDKSNETRDRGQWSLALPLNYVLYSTLLNHTLLYCANKGHGPKLQ